MVVARVARPAPLATTSTRKPSARRAAPAADDTDALAGQLDRVLKVSQPKASSSRATSATTTTTKTVRTAKSTAAPPAVAKPTATRPAAISSRTTLPSKQPAPSALAKGKAKAEQELPPWAKDEGMPSAERSKAATSAINQSLKTLSAAAQAGFRYGAKEGSGGEWTTGKVEKVAEEGRLAIKVLREMDGRGELGKGKTIEVERAGMALVLKCLVLDMHRQALDLLVAGQPHLLELYTPHPPAQVAAPKRSTPAAGPSQRRPATAPAGIPAPWRELLRLPAPAAGSEMDNSVRELACQAMLNAWICLLALHQDDETLIKMLAIPTTTPSPSTPLHPLTLALDLPPSPTIKTLLHLLYRQLAPSTLIPTSPTYLDRRRLAIMALSLTITTSLAEPSKNTPQQLWETTHKVCAACLSEKAGDEMCRAAGKVVAHVVEWVQGVVARRSESGWFAGNEWSRLLDFWLSIGRRLRDEEIIDQALSLLTASTSIIDTPSMEAGPSTPPSKASIPASVTQTPRPSAMSRQSSRSTRTKRKAEEAEREVLRLCGDLAKLNILLEKVSVESTDTLLVASADSALRSSDLDQLTEMLLSLDSGADGQNASEKASRALERVRRASSKVVNRLLRTPPTGGISAEEGSLALSAKQWLIAEVELVEEVLQVWTDAMPGLRRMGESAFDALINLSRLPAPSTQSQLSHLTRAYALTQSTALQLSLKDHVDWLRCLGSTAHVLTTSSYAHGKFAESVEAGRVSCDWATEANRLARSQGHEQLQGEDAQAWEAFEKQRVVKWDILGCAFIKSGRKEDGFEAFAQALASLPPTTIASLASETPVSSFGDLAGVIARLAQLLKTDTGLFIGRMGRITEIMRDQVVPTAVCGSILEKLEEVVEEASMAYEGVPELCMELAKGALDVCGADRSSRRLRLLVKSMDLICCSGLGTERFDTLRVEALELATAQLDDANPTAQTELHAAALLLTTLHAYHTGGNPSLDVPRLATVALTVVRGAILPPTSVKSPIKPVEVRAKRPLGRATTTKAPVRPRNAAQPLPDSKKPVRGSATISKLMTTPTKAAPRSSLSRPPLASSSLLIRLLGSLSALLGILCQPLAKIEALKLLRIVLRPIDSQADEYLRISALLAEEYAKLGKVIRARAVFVNAIKASEESKAEISLDIRAEVHLRFAKYLAERGDVVAAKDEYDEAARLAQELVPVTRTAWRVGQLRRAALAHATMAAMHFAEDRAAEAITELSAVVRLCNRASSLVCNLAPKTARQSDQAAGADDPFSMPSAPSTAEPGAKPAPVAPAKTSFTGKHLYGLQWQVAESYADSLLTFADSLAQRGSAEAVGAYLDLALDLAKSIRSANLEARIAIRRAYFLIRRRQFDEAEQELLEAERIRGECGGGSLDEMEMRRTRAELMAKREEEAEQVMEVLDEWKKGLEEVEETFKKGEELVPSPRKSMTSSIRTSLAGKDGKDWLLPVQLARVIRQQTWLFREAGCIVESKTLLSILRAIPANNQGHAEALCLDGRMDMHDAFDRFKNDLHMNALGESTIAMPMGNAARKGRDRLSTWTGIQTVIERSDRAYSMALSLVGASGQVEDVRQACLALAHLRAIQTSLGSGNPLLTASTASILATSSTITLHRELLDAISNKFPDSRIEDIDWPSFSTIKTPKKHRGPASPTPVRALVGLAPSRFDQPDDMHLRDYWQSVRARHSSNSFTTSLDQSEIDKLPDNWVVISMNITPDRRTLFVSRHEAGHAPLVFCLPIDRQARREGEDDEDTLTFEAAMDEMKNIVTESDASGRDAKHVGSTRAERDEWWTKRFALDKRLGKLLGELEFCWLGAFKTILASRRPDNTKALSDFRQRLDRIFVGALVGTGIDQKTAAAVRLDDDLLECLSRLSPKCKEEEIEDLVYFILDVYHFHGVPVALSELDTDQIGVDVRSALSDLELACHFSPASQQDASHPEHIFLALDSNTTPFPWESIPILRGRAVSRIPSLPILLDQIEMSRQVHVQDRRLVSSRKVFYILNPSGDLQATQAHFEPFLEVMRGKAGWKGIVGRAPTELEMVNALREYDLVLYFGHGGGECYIQSHKIRHLPQCAATMLWGCSSGALRDYGDLDRTGIPWHYMVAGCPNLTANLWDVTDRDIDRLSESVFQKLHLGPAHVPSASAAARGAPLLPLSDMSTVQAVNASRDECKLKYLTGAAVVCYGIPVYMC